MLKDFETMDRAILKLVFFLVFLISFIAPKVEAAYQIDKVRLLLSATKTVDTIHLTNPGTDNAAVNLQANAVNWTQTQGNDVFTPSNTLIVSPPIINIAPKKSQILRVGLRKPEILEVEGCYRVYLQEITPRQPGKMGVQFKINLGIPIFIKPSHPVYDAKFELHEMASSKKMKLLVNNTGNMHLQIISITLSDNSNKTIAENKTPFYLLPANKKEISFSPKSYAGNKLNLIIETDHEQIKKEISVLPSA